MKKKYSLKIFLYAVLGGTILASGCAISAFSFAWFSNNNNVSRGFDGSTTGAYFARGNGSEGNPYVINKPIHLYNLAWLQYVGFFKNKEPYFIIERDLDMSGWTLPPIGTTEYPFLGHLDGDDTLHSQGQGSTAKISNLTISNSFEKYNGRHPSSQTLSTFASPEITGLFGVVGDKKSTVEPSVKNLYLDKISIDSATNNALSGVVAGYVNGALSNILINDSSLNLKDGTNKLTGYDSISKYTSVGYCEPNYRTTYVKNNTTMYEPLYVGNASFNPTGGGGGEDQGWGGSINMLSLNRRFNYIGAVSTNTIDGAWNNKILSNSYNFSAFITNTNEFKWNETGRQWSNLIYINDGTLLPLNIDENKAFEGTELLNRPANNTLTDWHTTQFYKTHTSESEIIKKSNTGYLVGGGETNKNSTIRSRKQSLNSGLQNSFGSNAVPDKYDPNTIVFHSIDTTSGKEIEINSSNYGSFSRFNSVKEEFDSIMDKSPSTIHGFHFMNTINPNFLDIKEAENVVIDGLPEKNKYQFIKSALNFTVKERGYITTILGTYFYPDVKQSLFDIFKIERKSDGTIESAKQIKKIYGTKNDIHYSYDDSAVNNLLFDFTKVSGNQIPLSPLKAYYFEFPVLPGDYVIGKASDSDDRWNAYLMYLDIGANAGGTAGTKVDRTKVYELLEQISEGFTYPTGVAIVDFDNAVNDVKKLTITIGSTYSGSVTFNYNGNNNAQISVNASNSDTGLAYFDENMKINNGTITDSQVRGTITNTETQRLTYFDYDKETKITNVLTFSQTRESSSSAWGETKREDYQSGEGNTTFVGVSNLTIYGDDGKSTTDLPKIVDYNKIKKDTNVFKLKMLTPLESPLEANWLPKGSIPTEEDAANYYFTLTGYNFTLKKGTEALSPSDYSITKNANYALSINDIPWD